MEDGIYIITCFVQYGNDTSCIVTFTKTINTNVTAPLPDLILRSYPNPARDIKHVVLDYPFTDEGDVSLQVFMLANGRVSFPVLATVIYGWVTMPEYYSSFKKAWQRGKQAKSLENRDWFGIMELPLVIVQQQVHS